MPLKVLVVPDKFKGTLEAGSAAAAIARGWRRARRHDLIEVLPMSDGGDGFGPVLCRLLGARPRTVRTVDAAHRPSLARWWWQQSGKVAIIETAQVIGLAMLPPGRFHPFELDTFGLGAVLRAAIAEGAGRILVGIGGSATNDGGFGLARALGWKFFDAKGNEILSWTALKLVRRVDAPRRSGPQPEVVVAVDVENVLVGPRGATRIYGPQKGLRRSDFPRAEACLRALAAARDPEGRLARIPGTGAAGGLGFGLRAFAGARLVPGFKLFAQLSELNRRLRWADVVITGEGAIDRSTLMGKGVGEIAKRCRLLKKPCIGLGGMVELSAREKAMFMRTAALTDLAVLERAKRQPALWLEELAGKVAAEVTRL